MDEPLAGQGQEADGFANAMDAFAKEDAGGAPNAAVEGAAAKAVEPEAAPEPEPPPVPQKTEPEKLEDEFIEFTGKQKERFNSVYGALKRLERENAELHRRVVQPPQHLPQPVAPVVPQLFVEPKPKLGDFETADQWGDAVADWAARKAEHSAVNRTEQKYTQQETMRQQQEEARRVEHFLAAKTNDGYQKFGQTEFDNVCATVADFAPFGSNMNRNLFHLQRYADVVMELGKNLQEADRISRLDSADQIYELKTLEKKLIAREELARKTQKPNPTKVEAPGQGEDPKTTPSTAKLRQAAKASGSLKDFAAVFEADPTL